MRDTDGMSILKWLGLETAGGPEPIDGLSAVERALDDLEPAQARYLASFAYILGRVARADQEVRDVEVRMMEQMVAERGGLPAEQAALVVTIATREGLRHGGTEDFIVTRDFAATSTRDQKLALLDCLFAVSAADQSIRTVEDNAIRQIASELRLEHADFIAARRAHASHLRVLKKE
jgi:uncharacterized tellurite resistance protein B-like protein